MRGAGTRCPRCASDSMPRGVQTLCGVCAGRSTCDWAGSDSLYRPPDPMDRQVRVSCRWRADARAALFTYDGAPLHGQGEQRMRGFKWGLLGVATLFLSGCGYNTLQVQDEQI